MRIISIDNSYSGNPKYAVHFLSFINDEEKKSVSDLDELYALAIRKAKKVYGGAARKYHNKKYGGGISIETYDSKKEVEAEVEKIANTNSFAVSKSKKGLGTTSNNSDKKHTAATFITGFISGVALVSAYIGVRMYTARKGASLIAKQALENSTNSAAKSVEAAKVAANVETKVAEKEVIPTVTEATAKDYAESIRRATYITKADDYQANIDLLLSTLKNIYNPTDYKVVNEAFKQIDIVQPINGKFNLSIIDKLKETFIKQGESFSSKINAELERIGLSKNATGEWLSGTLAGLSTDKRVITLFPLVASVPNMAAGQMFSKGVDLGKEIERRNGIVTVLTHNNKIIYVPQESIV